jgi:hypothetical protein
MKKYQVVLKNGGKNADQARKLYAQNAIIELPNREEQAYLANQISSKKQKARAEKYLKESRKHLKLTKGPIHSQFAIRIT